MVNRIRRVGRLIERALGDRVSTLAPPGHRPEGAVFLAATLGTELARFTGSNRLEHLCKPLIAPAALTVALRDGRLGPVDTALLLATGAAYTTGDVVLMLGDRSESATGRALAPGRTELALPVLNRGAAAFSVGHLALGAMMIRSGIRPRPAPVAAHALSLVGAAALFLRSDGRRAGGLIAYSAWLSTLSALATSAPGSPADQPAPSDSRPAEYRAEGAPAVLLALGGPVFLLSDALIMANRSLPARSRIFPVLSAAVIDTYALAVLLLFSGAAATSRKAHTA